MKIQRKTREEITYQLSVVSVAKLLGIPDDMRITSMKFGEGLSLIVAAEKVTTDLTTGEVTEEDDNQGTP